MEIDLYYWAGTGEQKGRYFASIPLSMLERVIEDKKGAPDWCIETVGIELFAAAIALSLYPPLLYGVSEFLGTRDYPLKPINGPPVGVTGRKLTPGEAQKVLLEVLGALSGKRKDMGSVL